MRRVRHSRIGKLQPNIVEMPFAPAPRHPIADVGAKPDGFRLHDKRQHTPVFQNAALAGVKLLAIRARGIHRGRLRQIICRKQRIEFGARGKRGIVPREKVNPRRRISWSRGPCACTRDGSGEDLHQDRRLARVHRYALSEELGQITRRINAQPQ
jgi:hypothetical protein